MKAFDWNPLRSCFDGRIFNSLGEVPDDQLRYNIQAFRLSMSIPEPNKDKQLEAFSVWNEEAKRRRLIVGPRRVVPWSASLQGKPGTHFVGIAFTCPACGIQHCINTEYPNAAGVKFTWDGSWEEPTITEPVAVIAGNKSSCGFRLTKGSLTFHEDCHHSLAGTTVELDEV